MLMKYPTVEEIIETNRRVLELKKITKAEKHERIGLKENIQKAIDKSSEGKDVHESAAILLKEINKGHFFGSANKRTSFVAALNFIRSNGGEIPSKTELEQASFLLKVRNEDITIEEIRRWLRP
ncbi:MAG: type II toxin-antitoxin system death-on-curing family toxin [Candidatus Aenigmarchaeota archaeon]|nr:type II toxin-antitoxin system death-on-curing family toxin [Candidatus Aenigmarchaeota archaeon]